MNDRTHSMERSGASWSCHTYVEITWDTQAVCIIMLEVIGKLLLSTSMCPDLMVTKAYTYPNSFSISLSAFLPNNTGVAAHALVPAMRPCHIYPLPLVPPLTPS